MTRCIELLCHVIDCWDTCVGGWTGVPHRIAAKSKCRLKIKALNLLSYWFYGKPCCYVQYRKYSNCEDAPDSKKWILTNTAVVWTQSKNLFKSLKICDTASGTSHPFILKMERACSKTSKWFVATAPQAGGLIATPSTVLYSLTTQRDTTYRCVGLNPKRRPCLTAVAMRYLEIYTHTRTTWK